MDVLNELRLIAESQAGDFHPLILVGIALTREDGGEIVSIRTVAHEVLLRTLLTVPGGRQWLHDALDRLCDGTRPPDDQPTDAIIKHFLVASTETPRDGTGFPR